MNSYPDVAHQFCPDDRQRIGDEVVRLGDLYLTAITNFIEKSLENLRDRDGFQMLEDQVGGQAAVEQMRYKTMLQTAKKVTDVPPPIPGSESTHGEAKRIET